MKRNAIRIVLAGVVMALAAWQLAPAMNDGGTTPTAAPNPTTSAAPAAGAGFVVHFDESGQIVEEPTSLSVEDFNAALQQSISTSSEGLVEQATPVGGGVMVNLQGRFESAATATMDASGNVVVPCLTNENDVRAFTSSSAAESAAGKE